MSKIIIHIGREIQNHAPLSLLSPLLYFPECPVDADGHRLSQHTQDTVDLVRAHYVERAGESDKSAPLHIVTHAQCVLSVAGELVGLGKLRPEDVQVVMRGREPGGTEETTYHFDAEGVLSEGWPFGWFDWS